MRRLCVLIAVTAALVGAAEPVGRITSWGPVTLNGSLVPATAVASLPVVAGDEVATSSSAAVIVFRDRSRAAVEPNSRVKLEADGGWVRLKVLSGWAGGPRVSGWPTSLGQDSSLIRAATIGVAVEKKRSKSCPNGNDGSDGNCGKGNDSKSE